MTSTREAVRARRRQRRRRKAAALGVVAALIVAGAGTAWALSGSDGPRYRLATVRTGSVSQTVDAQGTLAAARIADAAFAVSGTVASVDVAVGDHVTAGQRLATMDTSSLAAAVAAAKNDVAAAEATVTDAEDGTVSATVAAAANGSQTGTGAGTRRATTSAAVTPEAAGGTRIVLTAATRPANGGTDLARHSAEVTRAATALVAALNGHIDTIATACGPTTTTTTSTVAAAAGADGTIAGAAADTTEVATAGHTGTVTADGSWRLTGLTAGDDYTVTITAQRDVVDAAKCSDAVDDAKDRSSDVARAVTAFDSAVAALQTAARSAGSASSGTGSAAPTTPRGPTAPKASTTPSAGKSRTPQSAPATSRSTPSAAAKEVSVSSEMLASYTAAATAAKAKLAVARAQAADAALTSPVTGTVASVGLTKGAAAEAASTSADVRVVADGALSMSLSIPLSKIALVRAGQAVHVTADGRAAAVPAKVTYVGVLDSASSTGSASAYTVTVALDAEVAGLRDGMGASAAIDVGTAADALVVPLSALHSAGARRTVEVYSDGTAVATPVTVGVVGADSAQVSRGLRAGQQVVVADLDAATPTSGSNTTTRGGFAGLRGAGAGGGRFRGGR